MKKPQIKFSLTNKNAVLPSYAKDGDAAFDVTSIITSTIKKGEIKVIPTGLTSEFDKDYMILIKDRSGLAVNNGINVMAGVIDSGYRGEWGIVLVNHGTKAYKIKKGDRIAQALFLPRVKPTIKSERKLKSSQRGKSGFGSSGK